ncbi:MAG TPA: hypothetical protein VN643_15660 [Pyrinomonadaceae bacterium]|nr:hypothetical protein [Pyrinomonadaceae bacterium]
MKLANKMQSDASGVDVLLLPFLEATTPEDEADRLTHLVNEYISPLVRQVVTHRLQVNRNQAGASKRNEDLEEVHHEIQLNLLKRLYDLKSSPVNKPVVNLKSYVAAAARNACDDYLRRQYPQRRHLRDHIRYCLLTHKELALWEETGKGWLSGLRVWRNPGAPRREHHELSANGNLQQLILDRLDHVEARSLNLPGLIAAILQLAGTPIEIDQLTGIIARSYGIEEHPTASLESATERHWLQLASDQTKPDELIECREHLERLWNEICQLPRRQRVALLCNLKDQHGINVITLFPATRIASFEQIAEALEIPPPEFENLWAKLPLDDLSLAQYLGINRQQVINLRRNARDRLMRRMKAFARQ